MWIARDLNDNIWMYSEKPKINKGEGIFEPSNLSDVCIDIPIFDNSLISLFGIKELKFENSPIEIEVKVKQ